ncbi:Serine/threonine-protein kinase ksp1 [Cyphellophora attinorum]|uniref:Serine/threonine-protein kinase ksp1 n=1 Tax=Cyphellophora attinorum TaxID=1664694 RepID=A0A0N0NPA7_9EURO|nr:Serine/threonine-protein kinase ksp1 [Phialophora attinorum]KPI42319.1 Serine/threonine-protein kinase ksp1 [Phialophora attinorum]
MDCMKDGFRQGEILDGRFRAVAELNHGSFGLVFLADDLLTGQQVAIKCLINPESTCGASTSDETADELDCHAVLHHPNLVNLIHHFKTKAHTYLVLEYCSQGDLYEAIRMGHGPLQTEHVRRFVLQLIEAVEHMHLHGIFHRDIKPENIFLTADGSMKLGDFGLATKSLWSFESCVGSDRYMAPEQYDASSGYSPAHADVWSIGICLLNVLFSRNPFVTPTEGDVLFADYRRDRQSLFDVFPAMSQDTFEVLSIALALDPQKRDMQALRRAVSRVISFTTDDESLDEFCTESRDPVRASANRMALPTPSITSPNMEGDAFPWTKALQTTPQRNLSVVPDTYEEDLFEQEKYPKLGESWYSGHATTPSLASVLDSAYGSLKAMAIRVPARNPPRPDPVPVPSSLPLRSSRPIPTMASVFGKKKDAVAKSWSDMFEEDEESEREEADLRTRREQNARTWSQDSQKQLPVPPGVLTESKSRSSSNARRSRTPKPVHCAKSIGGTNENDPSGWKIREDARRSPRQVPADKWAALGDKRRNFHPDPEGRAVSTKKRSMTTGSRRRPQTTFDTWHVVTVGRPTDNGLLFLIKIGGKQR